MKSPIFLLCLLVPGCTKNTPSAPLAPVEQFSAQVRDFFGEDVCAIVEGAEHVEVQRLDPSRGQGETGRGVALVGDPAVPTPEWIQRLKTVLENSQSYEWKDGKLCVPMPGLRVLCTKGEDSVALLLCFECEMLSMALAGEARWGDFDPARSELVRLAKELFPRDPVIQALQIGR